MARTTGPETTREGTAHVVESALAALRADPDAYEALVTDLQMSARMSGIDLARKARAIRPDLAVVLTSGSLRARDRSDARDAGVDAIVPKPCSMEQLAEHARLARRRRAAGS